MMNKSLYVIPFLILLGTAAHAQTDSSQSHLRVWTDVSQYVLGDTVIISAQTVTVIPDELLSYSITDPNGDVTHSERIVSADGNFVTRVYLTGNPVYGTYSVAAEYGDQRATATFEVTGLEVSDIVPLVADLSIDAGADVYVTGDTLQFSGTIEDIGEYRTSTPVRITISHAGAAPDGSGVQNSAKSDYSIMSFPDESGQYSASIKSIANLFDTGSYVVTAKYFDGTATNAFSIVEPLDLGNAAISIDSDVYGFGDTIYLDGTVPLSPETGLDIALRHPDGTVEDARVGVEDGQFSWSWTVPDAQRGSAEAIGVLGFYTISISSDETGRDIVFKVSEDPANDSLTAIPILVRTDKPLYLVEETFTVIGNVITGDQDGVQAPDRVTIQVNDGVLSFRNIYEAQVYPDAGGKFSAVFDIPITVFDEGTYIVRAIYGDSRVEATFRVVSEVDLESEQRVSAFVSPDRSEYGPGDVVTVTGGTNKPAGVEEFEVSIIQLSGTTCDPAVCQAASVAPGPSGRFTHQFVIPDDASVAGAYAVVVDAGVDTVTTQFRIVVEDAGVDTVTTQFRIVVEEEAPRVTFEKGHRIPDGMVTISTGEKVEDGTVFEPRVVFGSVATPAASSPGEVNLRVMSGSGTCIVGAGDDCLVTESTRGPGKIYDTVEADGVMLNVRYSGPDAQVEKFTILPESADAALPEADWSVEVVKADEQVSRFYYKVTYRTAQ